MNAQLCSFNQVKMIKKKKKIQLQSNNDNRCFNTDLKY